MTRSRPLLVLVSALLGAALLAGCTGDEAADPAPTGSGASSGGATGGTAKTELATAAELVTQQYLTAPEATPIATVKGKVRDGSGNDVPGTLDLLEVKAGSASTAVRWRLSVDKPIGTVSTNYYNNILFRIPATDEVALIAKQENYRVLSGTWSLGDRNSMDCTCAYVPRGLGTTGVELSNLYPALPDTVTEIQLQVRGFPALTAPVTRN